MIPTGNAFMDRNRPVLVYLLLTASVFVVYLNALSGTFQFDDYNMIVANASVHTWGAWLEKTMRGGIRPLLNLTYTMNWVSGSGVFGFHLLNVFIHATATLLVYALCRRFTSSCRQELLAPDHARAASLLAALLFAVHPLQTEAVTYITGRSSSLMAMLFLASLLAYLHGVETKARQWQFVISPLLFIAAVAAKEVAVFLPFALLFWELCANRTAWKTLLLRQAVHWVLMLILVAVILSQPRYATLFMYSLEIRSFHDNLFSQLNGFSYLVSRLFMPGSLNIDPDIRVASEMDLRMYLTLIVCAAAVFAAFLKRHSRPWLMFALLWFAVAVFPGSALIPRADVVNERHMYLANFGIFLCAGIETVRLGDFVPLGNIHKQAILAVIICSLGVFTVMRNFDYKNEIALWESSARLSPGKSRVFNNLGCAYELAGLKPQATAAYSRSAALNSDNPVALKNLARSRSKILVNHQ